MYRKIKEIRTYLELSESEISSLLNISSYKYRRYEDGTIDISSEDLILLAFMYDIPIDYLILSKYKNEEIFSLSTFYGLNFLDSADKLLKLQRNLCAHCSFSCTTVNYKVIKNIINSYKNIFANNLYSSRVCAAVEVNLISMYLKVSENDYLMYEQGRKLPAPLILADIAVFFNNSIQHFFNKKKT